ncbi:GIDE domain-containing protein, partial [Candidatus Riflebacteria bacterium]
MNKTLIATPLKTIADIKEPGYYKVSGVVRIKSPLCFEDFRQDSLDEQLHEDEDFFDEPLVDYLYVKYRRVNGSRSSTTWVPDSEPRSKSVPFEIVDQTGRIKIFPEGAELVRRTLFNKVMGDSITSLKISNWKQYRIEFSGIKATETVLVCGRVIADPASNTLYFGVDGETKAPDQYFLISAKTEDELLSENRQKVKEQVLIVVCCIIVFVVCGFLALYNHGLSEFRKENFK